MIIIDDRLSRIVLGGQRPELLAGAELATTWGFQYRLVRALIDDRVEGRLSRGAAEGLRSTAAAPPPGVLAVLDPRELTQQAAELAIGHRLNLLVAELLAAATHHRATVALSEGNVGRSWPALFEDRGVPLEVIA